jgi:hypothetical protein
VGHHREERGRNEQERTKTTLVLAHLRSRYDPKPPTPCAGISTSRASQSGVEKKDERQNRFFFTSAEIARGPPLRRNGVTLDFARFIQTVKKNLHHGESDKSFNQNQDLYRGENQNVRGAIP